MIVPIYSRVRRHELCYLDRMEEPALGSGHLALDLYLISMRVPKSWGEERQTIISGRGASGFVWAPEFFDSWRAQKRS